MSNQYHGDPMFPYQSNGQYQHHTFNGTRQNGGIMAASNGMTSRNSVPPSVDSSQASIRTYGTPSPSPAPSSALCLDEDDERDESSRPGSGESSPSPPPQTPGSDGTADRNQDFMHLGDGTIGDGFNTFLERDHGQQTLPCHNSPAGTNHMTPSPLMDSVLPYHGNLQQNTFQQASSNHLQAPSNQHWPLQTQQSFRPPYPSLQPMDHVYANQSFSEDAWSPLRMQHIPPAAPSNAMWDPSSFSGHPSYSVAFNTAGPDHYAVDATSYDMNAQQYPHTQAMSPLNHTANYSTSQLPIRQNVSYVNNSPIINAAPGQGPYAMPPFPMEIDSQSVVDLALSPQSAHSEQEVAPPYERTSPVVSFIHESANTPTTIPRGHRHMNVEHLQVSKPKRGRRPSNTNGVTKTYTSPPRTGGRVVGTHLPTEKATMANLMRKKGTCWRCKIQRDKCDLEDPCKRCVNRTQKPGADFILCCRREPLVNLVDRFRPDCLALLHGRDTLMQLCDDNIREWRRHEINIWLTVGNGLPWLEIKVCEFDPKNPELLRQFQYVRDPVTREPGRQEKVSPPLGLVQMDYNKDELKYDAHVKQIAAGCMDKLAARYHAGEKESFAKDLFLLLAKIKPIKGSDEHKLLLEVYYLIITSYILAHTWTLADDQRNTWASELQYRNEKGYADKSSPRMANRQVKHFYSRLHHRYMYDLLNKLQQVFQASKGCERWSVAFIIVLGLAIALEMVQKNVHTIMDSKWSANEVSQSHAEHITDNAVDGIDFEFGFLLQIYGWKYSRSCNPIKDCHNDWSKKLGDSGLKAILPELNSLIRNKHEYLESQRIVDRKSIHWRRYTSRLTSRFLLSFLDPAS